MELKQEPKIGLEFRLQKMVVVASISAVLITISIFVYTNLVSSTDTFASGKDNITISGKVFCDANKNGKKDKKEADVEHVLLKLYDDADSDGVLDVGEKLLDSIYTKKNGDYSFKIKPPSSGSTFYYIVTADSSNFSGTSFSTSSLYAFALKKKAKSKANHFGLVGACSAKSKGKKNKIRGKVFNDKNKNGKRDGGEGNKKGVKIYLYKDKNVNKKKDTSDELVDSTTTDGSGKYDFDVDHIDASNVTFTSSISSGSNDAQENSKGTVTLNGTSLNINKYVVGLYYPGITLPQGAKITSAYLTFTADVTSNKKCDLKIYGEDRDNASAYTYTKNNIYNRKKTSKYTKWRPPNFTGGKAYQTDEIKEIVQEIVNRSKWKTGNAMSFMIKKDNGGYRPIKSYDGNSSKAPVLTIVYEGTATGSNQFITEIVVTSTVTTEIATEFTVGGTESTEIESAVFDPSTLPVEFMYFKADYSSGQAELTWATAMEKNNSHFEVQRSVDASTFEVIGSEPGNGNAQNVIEYSYNDPNVPQQGNPIYYRLKQIDYDGGYDYSPTVYIQSENELNTKVYPNPATNFINVSKTGFTFNATLMDHTGLPVEIKNSQVGNTQFALSNVPNGVYILEINSIQGSESFKVLVKH